MDSESVCARFKTSYGGLVSYEPNDEIYWFSLSLGPVQVLLQDIDCASIDLMVNQSQTYSRSHTLEANELSKIHLFQWRWLQAASVEIDRRRCFWLQKLHDDRSWLILVCLQSWQSSSSLRIQKYCFKETKDGKNRLNTTTDQWLSHRIYTNKGRQL